jgi:esterase
MRVHNEGIGLHVEQEGEGPPLVLLHGITYSTVTYDWLVPQLRDRYTTHAMDFRGHGRSDRAPGAYLLGDFVSDAIAVVHAIGEPAVLVGHSLGGVAAACVAQLRPELVRGLFLEDPALYAGGRRPERPEAGLLAAFALLRDGVPDWQAQGLTVADLRPPFAAAPAAIGGTLGEQLTEDGLDAMLTALLQLDAAVLDPVLEGTSPEVYRTDEPLEVPATILAPDPEAPDGLLKLHHLEELRALSPDLRIEVLDGAGHLIHDARAHRPQYVAHLRSFLADLG